MNFIDKETEAVNETKKFQRIFYKKFGVVPKVVYELTNLRGVSLELVGKACGTILNMLDTQYYPEGIQSFLNDKNILLCRQIFYFIAINNGHKYTRAAAYLKQASPNAKHAFGRINSQLAAGDERTISSYRLIKIELDKLTFENI